LVSHTFTLSMARRKTSTVPVAARSLGGSRQRGPRGAGSMRIPRDLHASPQGSRSNGLVPSVVIPAYTRKVLFPLTAVSSVDPFVNSQDLLTMEGRTAGYTSGRFRSVSPISAEVWGPDGSRASDAADLGIGLKLASTLGSVGDNKLSMELVSTDYGVSGASRPSARGTFGRNVAGEWYTPSDGQADMLVRITNGLGVDLTKDQLVGVLVGITARFR